MTDKQERTFNPHDVTIVEQYRIDQILDQRGVGRWYDRVYLCYENTRLKPPNTYAPIIGFHCYRYNSFYSADHAWATHHTDLHPLNVRHTMLSVCKWVPQMFDPFILQWKLKRIYWGGNIHIGCGTDTSR